MYRRTRSSIRHPVRSDNSSNTGPDCSGHQHGALDFVVDADWETSCTAALDANAGKVRWQQAPEETHSRAEIVTGLTPTSSRRRI